MAANRSAAAHQAWDTKRAGRPGIAGLAARFRKASARLEYLGHQRERVAAERTRLVTEMLDDGWSLAEVGAAVGLSKSAVAKISRG